MLEGKASSFMGWSVPTFCLGGATVSVFSRGGREINIYKSTFPFLLLDTLLSLGTSNVGLTWFSYSLGQFFGCC